MQRKTKFYIAGKWVAPSVNQELEVFNPADETAFAVISLGTEADVDRAVAAARAAFPVWSDTSLAERLAKLETLAGIYKSRINEIAEFIKVLRGQFCRSM